MFSEMLARLQRGETVDLDMLSRRFAMAMTKKLAIVKLPPAFWSGDPKINPPGEHLLLAALLLGDRELAAMAVSVVAVEKARELEKHPIGVVVQDVLKDSVAEMPGTQQLFFADRAAELLSDCLQ